jgi:quinohemoprotein amine dehydrogenase
VDNQPMNGGQGFRGIRSQAASEDGGAPPDSRYPMDRVIAHLSKTFPLMTPEWARWSAAMQPAQLAGRWAVSGEQLGKGPIFGQVVIAPDPAGGPDYFTTETRYTIARTGETVTRQGRAVVYAGFQWRGRGATPGSQSPWSEVLFVERDRREMSGRWYTGAYDETGIDVRLVRLGGGSAVFGSSVTALKTPSSGQAVTLYGADLPTSLRPQDISFGQGVTVTRVVSARADQVAVEVEVAPNAPVGPRDVSIAGVVKPAALVVYDKIDGLKVVPEAGMARVGGNVFPKGFQQFEAIGVNYGPDGNAGTADDLDLGIMDVRWSLEEYTATFGDDDITFVGSVDDGGLFTPNVDGPNPARSGNRNNVGDVWVVAELPTTGSGAKPLRARAHLLVTVPIYMAWFESEGGR